MNLEILIKNPHYWNITDCDLTQAEFELSNNEINFIPLKVGSDYYKSLLQEISPNTLAFGINKKSLLKDIQKQVKLTSNEDNLKVIIYNYHKSGDKYYVIFRIARKK